MGHLDILNHATSRSLIEDKSIKSILIIGAALKSKMLNYFLENGDYSITVMDNSSWAIKEANLNKKSITIFNKNAITHNDYSYDLVISFIMEHIQYSDAIFLWDKITSQAKKSVFIVYDGQHSQEPFEENLGYAQITEYWDQEMINRDFTNIDSIENLKEHLIVKYNRDK